MKRPARLILPKDISSLLWLFLVLSLLKLLRNKDPARYPLTVGALAALMALSVAGLFEYNFGDSEITVLFLYIITLPFTSMKNREAEPG